MLEGLTNGALPLLLHFYAVSNIGHAGPLLPFRLCLGRSEPDPHLVQAAPARLFISRRLLCATYLMYAVCYASTPHLCCVRALIN